MKLRCRDEFSFSYEQMNKNLELINIVIRIYNKSELMISEKILFATSLIF